MHVTPYLSFNGRCEEAFKLYERVTGGKIVAMITYDQTPAASQASPEWQKKIIHARLQIGNEFLMGADAPPDRHKPAQGISVTLSVDTPEQAEQIYKGLSDGGIVHMPLDKTFFAQKFGMFNDKFGVPWMVICEREGSSAQNTARSEREKVA
jgi:PhnB protein